MIPQYEPSFGYLEKKMICDYMDDPGWITEYKKTQEFERRIADYLGVAECITTNNGTMAISLALLAAEVNVGDIVVIPSMTMYATATAVSLIGAKPLLVDVNDSDLLMNLDVLPSIIDTYRPKSVIFVSLNGRWNTTGRLLELQRMYPKVSFIEDAAQAFGSYRGVVGSSLSMSTFSFSVPKIITTGQGGCVTTNNVELAGRLRKLKDFGRSAGELDTHDSFGINSKFTEFQAIIGIAQLQQIYYRTSRKRQMYELYSNNLSGIDGIRMVGMDDKTVPWFMDVRADNRDDLMSFLKEQGIGTRKVYTSLNNQRVDRICRVRKTYPSSEAFADTGLWLPSSFTLKDDDILFICNKIREFYINEV
jgi:perosamine synthetase